MQKQCQFGTGQLQVYLVHNPDTLHGLPRCRKAQVEVISGCCSCCHCYCRQATSLGANHNYLFCSTENLSKGTAGGGFPDHCFSSVLPYHENTQKEITLIKERELWTETVQESLQSKSQEKGPAHPPHPSKWNGTTCSPKPKCRLSHWFFNSRFKRFD